MGVFQQPDRREMMDAEYVVAKDLDGVFQALEGRRERARFIAGCTNVIPNIRSGAISPEILIDLSGIKDLVHIREEEGRVSIGALTTIAEVSSSGLIREACPILASAAKSLGNPLTRNRATLGGNLADASPAADTAPPLLALEAAVHTVRPGGRTREIPLDRFFVGPRHTVLEKDEVVTRITFPKPKDPLAGSHIKFGLRNAMAISVASVAVMLEREGKRCRKARVALGSVAPKPIRAYGVEKRLEGEEVDRELLEACALVVREEISPISDIRASAEYRRLVASVLFRRAVDEALKG